VERKDEGQLKWPRQDLRGWLEREVKKRWSLKVSRAGHFGPRKSVPRRTFLAR
jgi:hypothetical protein